MKFIPVLVKAIVELIASAAILYGIYTVLENRRRNAKTKDGPVGLGARTIQFVTVTILLPAVLILGLEDKLHSETLGTLLGALAGYLLSRIGDYDSNKG